MVDLTSVTGGLRTGGVRLALAVALVGLCAPSSATAADSVLDEPSDVSAPAAPVYDVEPSSSQNARFARNREGLKASIDELREQRRALLEELVAQRWRHPDLSQGEAGRDGWDFLLDPMIAPRVPVEREPPLAAFDERTLRQPTWTSLLFVREETLDADRNGHPEQIRYLEPRSRELLRRELDRNYDGEFDLVHSYEQGQLAKREVDTDYDGRFDVVESYAAGVMTRREVDRDQDGVFDGVYIYADGLLAEEQHDTDNKLGPNRVIRYRDRVRVAELSDRNADGRIDEWMTFTQVSGKPVATEIERDSHNRGRADTFESYSVESGAAVLAERREDLDGDGAIDVRSVYQRGRLVKREILDPNAADL